MTTNATGFGPNDDEDAAQLGEGSPDDHGGHGGNDRSSDDRGSPDDH